MLFMKSNQFILVILSGLCIIPCSFGQNWTQNNNNFNLYALVSSPLPFEYAKRICEQLNSHLVTITTLEEELFVAHNFIKSTSSSSYWIGLERIDDRSPFKWLTNEEFDSIIMQQQNAGSSKLCAIIDWNIQKNSMECERAYPFICERDTALPSLGKRDTTTSELTAGTTTQVLPTTGELTTGISQNQISTTQQSSNQSTSFIESLTTSFYAKETTFKSDKKTLAGAIIIPIIVLAFVTFMVGYGIKRQRKSASKTFNEEDGVRSDIEMSKSKSSKETSTGNDITSAEKESPALPLSSSISTPTNDQSTQKDENENEKEKEKDNITSGDDDDSDGSLQSDDSSEDEKSDRSNEEK